MKANEVRKLSAAELQSKLVDLKKDLFDLRLQHACPDLVAPGRREMSHHEDIAVCPGFTKIKKQRPGHCAHDQDHRRI